MTTSIINVVDWLGTVPGLRYAPLFEEAAPLQVAVKAVNGRELLVRSAAMEAAMIDLIEAGLQASDWEGLLYVMGCGPLEHFRILYVGKAERKGVRHELSANIANIRTNKHKFARWGDGIAYHIGDLSHAMFEFEAYRKPSPKYRRWAQALFSSYRPPVMKETAFLCLIPWYQNSMGPSGLISSLPAAEKEVIALAGWQFPDCLLNRDGI